MIFKKYIKKLKIINFRLVRVWYFLGFFFIFLIAGRKTATAKIENGLTHVFRCLAHMQFSYSLISQNRKTAFHEIRQRTSFFWGLSTLN